MPTIALACTGDPLLDLMLARCASFTLRPVACETVEEALREAETHKPAILFASPALGDIRPLQGLKHLRICYLLEGTGQTGLEFVEVIAAGRITPDLVDGWVRRPTPSGVQAKAATSPIPPPPPLPTAGGKTRAAFVLPAPEVEPAPQHRPPQAQSAPADRPTTGRLPSHPRSEAPRPALSVLRQQVVTLWGGKPGAGRSTLAVALSDLLSRAGAIRVCTVDLNPCNSSLAALVGKEQEVPSWFHLSQAIAKGSPFPVDALRWVKPNWAILSGPDGRPEWMNHLTPQAIHYIVDGLRTQFDYIVLDAEARPGPVSETAVRLAQMVLITVSADYPDVLDTTRAYEAALEQGWLDRGRSRLILNRWLETPHLPASDVADCFSLPVSLTVPSSAEAAVHASSQGIPVTQLELPAGRNLAQAIGPLVGLVAEQVVAAGLGRNGFGMPLRGWFSR